MKCYYAWDAYCDLQDNNLVDFKHGQLAGSVISILTHVNHNLVK